MQSKTGVPLCSFENNSEYVYDVKWSPTHPAVFASVDGEGRLDFWNINSDTEVGLYSVNGLPWSLRALQVPILSEALDVCLSKLHWAPTGHHVAVGDCEGKVYIYEAGEVCTFDGVLFMSAHIIISIAGTLLSST